MNKKKILVLAMTLSMVAILAMGATLAYFTADEQVTNTMVVGNIDINIDEFSYLKNEDGEYEWKKFENDKFVLYPIDNEQGNAINNKIVYTANTSTSEDAAYIRNIVLFEANDQLLTMTDADCCFPGIHYGFATNEKTTSSVDGKTYVGSASTKLDTTVEINGEKYWVAIFEEKDGNPIAYDNALYSLSGVWMDENITSEQIAGWGEDGKVNIIVYSQGIQAEGLTHEQAMAELGEVNQSNLTKWIGKDDAEINDWTEK